MRRPAAVVAKALASDPFTVLGVPRRFDLDAKALEQRYRDLSRALHPDRHAMAAPAERRLALERSATVNDAFRVLKNPQTRATALLATAGRTVEEHHRADPATLMEVMELREALESVRTGDPCVGAIEALRADVSAKIRHEERTIAEAFDGDRISTDSASLDRAHEALVKLRYLYRFMEEADEIES